MINETIQFYSIHTQQQLDALNHSINLIMHNGQYIAADGRIENFNYSSNLRVNGTV